MKTRTLMMGCALCMGAIALALMAGCSAPNIPGGGTGAGGAMMGGGGSGAGQGGGSGTGGYSSVGERIYLTGVGSDGRAIPRSSSAGSGGSYMMGGNGCGACHGANGRGGTIRVMMGASIKTPDITYDALIKAGFTETTIGRAIRNGLDQAGQPLKSPMPQWQMSDADIAATIAYLKVLGAK